MDDALRIHLEELDALIRTASADGEIDAHERAELAQLIERVRDDLAAADPDHDSVADRLEKSAVKFEGRHPEVAGAIHRFIHGLTGLGI